MPRKSFILYTDQYESIKEFTDKQKSELLDSIYMYHCDTQFKISDPCVKTAFNFFKTTFTRDNVKYEARCLKNKENIEKRWGKKQ